MKILNFPRKSHQEREKVNRMATGSVNMPGKVDNIQWRYWWDKLAILRKVDEQLAPLSLEVVVLENGPDALIWKIEPASLERAEGLPKDGFVEQPPLPLFKHEEQTSNKVAALAAALLNMDDEDIIEGVNTSPTFIKNIRSIAGSALTQSPQKERDDGYQNEEEKR